MHTGAHPRGDVRGTVHFTEDDQETDWHTFGKPSDSVRIVARRSASCSPARENGQHTALCVKARVRSATGWQVASVQLIPVRDQIFSRFGGIIETGALSDSHVFIAGVGSVGSAVALDLVKAGVGSIDLMDHDRLEVANVARHPSPLSHVGRYKTKSLADVLDEKNPYCDVSTWEEKVTWEDLESVRERIRESDLVVCGLDSHQGRLIINRLCLQENTPCLFAGLRRRAYGGQVLFARPFESMCYQCFILTSPDAVVDREISSEGQAQRLAYTDKPVPIEPGLATDIAPITTMVAKLAIQFLLKGKPTTLRSLDEDLVAALYVWINRRETGSPFADLSPMAFDVEEMSILRWYGLPVQRVPECPACGDPVGKMAEEKGIEIPEESVKAFRTAGECTCSSSIPCQK